MATTLAGKGKGKGGGSQAHQKAVIAEKNRLREEDTPQQEMEKTKWTWRKNWSVADAENICDRIAQGEILIHILKEDEMPAYNQFFDMVNNNEEIRKKYESARKTSATVLVEKTLEEADNERDPAMAALLRVKADARRWAAARFAPDLYGDVKRLEVSGEVRHAHALDLTQEQRARIAQEWIMAIEGGKQPALIEGTAETSGPARNQRPKTGAGGARRKIKAPE